MNSDKPIPIKGEVKEYKLIDNRRALFNPFDSMGKLEMINPFSWEISGADEGDGFRLGHPVVQEKWWNRKLNSFLLRIENKKIIEAFELIRLEQGHDSAHMRKDRKVFLSQNINGDWFMIPKNKKELWLEVKDMDINELKTKIAYEEFEQYRVEGNIEDIFFDPR